MISLLEPFLNYIALAVGAIIGLTAFWAKAKSSGRKAERNEQLKESYENERKRQDLEDRYRNASPDDASDMRESWFRD